MLDSPFLGTAIGLVLIFATASLLSSGIAEAVSNWLQLRAKYLLTGLRLMLDAPVASGDTGKPKSAGADLDSQVKDRQQTRTAAARVAGLEPGDDPPDAGTVTTALFNSPLLQSLQGRRVGLRKNGALRNPQYISGKSFAHALLDLLVPASVNGAAPLQLDLPQVTAAVAKLPSEMPLRRQLLAFIKQANGDLSTFETSLEQWYDQQMAMISGWYKRWSRVILGIIGLVIAVLANLDTLQVAHVLYTDSPVQQAVISTADAGTICSNESTPAARGDCATAVIGQLKVAGVPLGYPSGCDPVDRHWARCWSWTPNDQLHPFDLPLKLLGWLVTAFAVSFGAPFWFDTLSRLGSLRNTGAKPAAS